MTKALRFVLPVIFAVYLFVIGGCSDRNPDRGSKNKPAGTDRIHGFDRRVSFLEYTRHAKCRMECRHITPEEVREIMQNGTINYRKSEEDEKPCPVYALEGRVNNERLRIIFAQCDQKTKVVTVIDLDKEWECDCPGDQK
jgi:hypothetical protein